MNYYEHHIGDYAEATQHLSILEDGVYCRLLRKYYASERALPREISAVQRLVVAKSKDERVAVESVLQEFFVLEDDGWRQPRCDKEIERFRAGQPEREAKKANEENRQKRHREERTALFAVLAANGEHAPWNMGIEDLRKRVSAIGREGHEPATATKPATTVGQNSDHPATAPETLPVTAPATPATATGKTHLGSAMVNSLIR